MIKREMPEVVPPPAQVPAHDRPSPPFWWAVIQISALAAHMPLTLLMGSSRAVADSASVLGVSFAVAALALALYLLMSRMGVPGWRALAWTSIGTVLFWHASGVGTGLPIPPWVTQLAMAALVLAAAAKFAETRQLKVGLLTDSLALGGTMAIQAGVAVATTPPPVVGPQEQIGEFELTVRPDIYLLVLDGYARDDVILRVFGYDNSAFTRDLESHGMTVHKGATANYPLTHFSIPSLMNMAYVHPEGAEISSSDLSTLARGVGGDNYVVDTLKANGYSYVHGEAISRYNRCGQNVDRCLKGPLIDSTSYPLLENTPVGPLLYRATGDPATWLNLTRIQQMVDWESMESEFQDGPTFTFLHLILPHPPLFLDRHCSVRLDPDLRGSTMVIEDIPPEFDQKRRDAWLEQVECANQTTMAFLEQIDSDSVVIITSDHGSDAEYPLFGDVHQYTTEHLEERMPTLTATRLPDRCEGLIPDDVSLVNVFRYVFACLADQSPDPLPNRTFLASFGGYVFEVEDLERPSD